MTSITHSHMIYIYIYENCHILNQTNDVTCTPVKKQCNQHQHLRLHGVIVGIHWQG